MSVQFPLSDFFQSSGNAAAEFSENLRDGIATFACSIWQNYPAFITEGTNPGSSFARGFMNQMCSPIQSPVPLPTVPFQGGQCDGVTYFFRFETAIISAGTLAGWSAPVNFTSTSIIGAVASVKLFVNNVQDEDLEHWSFDGNGEEPFINERNKSYRFDFEDAAGNVYSAGVGNHFGVRFIEFFRQDGMADNCGNVPVDYPSSPPTSIDLTTTITITNLDTVDNTYVLTYNKLTNQYNFPMNFKLNGTNVTLDIGGITIFGAPEITNPTSGNDVPLPGSDGGDDGVGGNNDTTYPGTEYPTVPDLNVPITTEQLIEYVVCTDGVLTTVSELVKIATSFIPYTELVIGVLTNILTDVCEDGDVEPTIGFPEYYGVKPGAQRPAIVYLYKEVINDKWQASTYSSTVHNPTQAAIDNINSINVPDKDTGIFITNLNLLDGSRIRATGNNSINSRTNFNFLLNQVNPVFIPNNPNDFITETTYPQLQEKTLKCRQIEYYPTGKAAGINPAIRRVIDLP